MARTNSRVWFETAAGLLLIGAAVVFLYVQNPAQATDPRATLMVADDRQGGISIMFSAPGLAQAEGAATSPESPLVESLNGAEFSIEAALYDLDLPTVRDALIAAHERGVRVRLVTEGTNSEGAAFQSLALAGVPLVADPRPGLMHHKFLIIDELEVWTGSTNLTWSGFFRNDNNQVRIRSDDMVVNYRREFEEMFLEERFGPLSRSDTPYPAVTLGDGSRAHVYFSPDDGAARAILRELEGARLSIDLLAFTLTADPIAEALLEAADRGVRVRGVVEAVRADAVGSDVERLREAGLEIQLDTNTGNMHHKVLIIDRSIVITGSYNFSNSAEERNDENLMILYSEELARKFGSEFERLLAAAVR